MTTAVLVGSTGLVGSHILTHLLSQPAITSIYAYSRRDLPNPNASPKLYPLISTDTNQWASQFPRELSPKIFFSGLGTTRAQAGSLDAQRKIDLDLNLELAKAAKDAGVETYVLISSGGASSTSRLPYTKMKGELEDRVKELGFKHTVILRPGLLVGERQDSRLAEAALRNIAKGLRAVSPWLTDGWAQDAGVIAGAAVNAGVKCFEGKREEGVWEIGQAEILKLGKEV